MAAVGQKQKLGPEGEAGQLFDSQEYQLRLAGSTASRHGWVRVSDGTERVFYHNINSGKITLERPEHFGEDNPTWDDGACCNVAMCENARRVYVLYDGGVCELRTSARPPWQNDSRRVFLGKYPSCNIQSSLDSCLLQSSSSSSSSSV